MTDVVLRFIAGRQPGREIPVENERELTIGRAEDADLRIDEDTVSRKHATLFVKNDEIVLRDCQEGSAHQRVAVEQLEAANHGPAGQQR